MAKRNKNETRAPILIACRTQFTREERDRAPYTGTREDFIRVKEIQALIEKLGGIQLIWV